MAATSNWQFYKEAKSNILWNHICAKDLSEVAISINKWWKTRYPECKIRLVSKKEFEQVRI